MKVVVIGGTGLIGSKVVPSLHQRGYDVVAANQQEWAAVTARLTKKLSDAGYEVFFESVAETDPAKITVLLHDPEFEETVENALNVDT